MSAAASTCASLEDLAALAEGRLAGAERERVVAHVAACLDCREVLAETLAVLGDIAAGEGEAATAGLRPAPAGTLAGGATPPSSWRRPAALAALAAGLVLAAAVVVVQRSGAPAPPDRAAWIAALPPAETLLPDLWGGAVMRGVEEEAALPGQSAELGALLVDLEVALAAGDAARAAALLHGMAAVAEAAGLLDEDAARLRRLAAAGEAGLAEAARGELPAVEARLRKRFSTFHLDLGGFAEGARLAAAAGRAEALGEARTQRYLEWVLAQDEQPLPAGARAAVEVLRRPDGSGDERERAADELLRELTR